METDELVCEGYPDGALKYIGEDKNDCSDCEFKLQGDNPYGCPLIDNNLLSVKEFLIIQPLIQKITEIIGCQSWQEKRITIPKK